MVWHGKVWCGVDQAKKQPPHLKTGSPLGCNSALKNSEFYKYRQMRAVQVESGWFGDTKHDASNIFYLI